MSRTTHVADKEGTRDESKTRLVQSEYEPSEDETRHRGEMFAAYVPQRGRSASAPSAPPASLNNNDRGGEDEAKAATPEEDLEPLQQEWKLLLSGIRLPGDEMEPSQREWKQLLSEVTLLDVVRWEPEVRPGRRDSGDSPARSSPFPSTLSSSTLEFDLESEYSEEYGDFVPWNTGGWELPTNINIKKHKTPKPKPKHTCKQRKLVDFGVPGDYTNSIAYREALPILLDRKPQPSGSDGVRVSVSGESEREASEPMWEFPSYGMIAQDDPDIVLPQSTNGRIDLWLDEVDRAHAEHPVDNEPPPFIEASEWDKTDWDNLAMPSQEHIMVTPPQSQMEPGPEELFYRDKQYLLEYDDLPYIPNHDKTGEPTQLRES